ncbi:MAG: glycosyltransferase [Edaphobacter sp.]
MDNKSETQEKIPSPKENMSTTGAAIPKHIIQTGKSISQSTRVRAMMSNIRLLNSDYEYLFFDDQQVDKFITQEFPKYRTVFDTFRFPIQRYDFFRYLAVYRYGGFYFDLDVLLASNLSSLLESGCIFPFEGLTYSHFLRTEYQMDWEIGNYGFGATAGHPFIGAVIENCVRAQKDPVWVAPMMHRVPLLSKSEFYVLYTTGPGLVSRTLAENPELARSVRVLFPDDVCDMTNWNCFGNLGVHLMDASWRVKKGRVRRKLALKWEEWKLSGLLKRSAVWGKTRQHSYPG